MRICMMSVCALILAAPALGTELVSNPGFESGDVSPWVQWGPIGWGTSAPVNVQTDKVYEGSYAAQIPLGDGSYGFKQVVTVPAGAELTFSCYVNASNPGGNWAEVLLYPYEVVDDGDIDVGLTSAPYMIWKRDSFPGDGNRLPTLDEYGDEGWEKVTGKVSSATGAVTVAFKWGGFASGNMFVDSVSLTTVPEPASLLILLAALPLLRRSRR